MKNKKMNFDLEENFGDILEKEIENLS